MKMENTIRGGRRLVRETVKDGIIYKLNTDLYRTIDYIQNKLSELLDYEDKLYYLENNNDNLEKILNNVFGGDMLDYTEAIVYGRYKPSLSYIRVNRQLEIESVDIVTLKAIYIVNIDEIVDIFMEDDELLEQIIYDLKLI